MGEQVLRGGFTDDLSLIVTLQLRPYSDALRVRERCFPHFDFDFHLVRRCSAHVSSIVRIDRARA